MGQKGQSRPLVVSSKVFMSRHVDLLCTSAPCMRQTGRHFGEGSATTNTIQKMSSKSVISRYKTNIVEKVLKHLIVLIIL